MSSVVCHVVYDIPGAPIASSAVASFPPVSTNKRPHICASAEGDVYVTTHQAGCQQAAVFEHGCPYKHRRVAEEPHLLSSRVDLSTTCKLRADMPKMDLTDSATNRQDRPSNIRQSRSRSQLPAPIAWLEPVLYLVPMLHG